MLRLNLSFAVVLLFVTGQSTGATQPAPCKADEGAAVAAKLDLQVCSGTTQTKVATYETPQAGARVVAVTSGGAAAKAGLRAGDVIYQVEGRRVESGKAASEALAAAGAPGAVIVNFWRDERMYLVRIWTDAK